MVSSPGAGVSKETKSSMFRKRFSDDQIRLLETIFESETRLEPRKKVQVATQLGLQPRQVSIWFQNKRARWKSKQLEHEFKLLRSNYDALHSSFQAMNKEKQALASQLQKVTDSIARRRREEENSGGPKSENAEPEEKHSLSFEGSESEDGVLSELARSDYGRQRREEDEAKVATMGYGPNTTSQENWSSLDSDSSIFPPSNSIEWWDFWSRI